MGSQYWLLIRGLNRQQRHWADFPQKLETAMPEQHFFSLDLPGFGELRHQKSPTSVAGITANLRQQWLQRGYPLPINLLSISLGSMVARYWMETWTDEIASAVLINTSAAGICPFWHRLRIGTWPAFMQTLLTTKQQRQKIIHSILSQMDPNPQQTLALWQQIQQQQAPLPSNTLRQLWAAFRYRPSAQTTGHPLLILSSAQDRMVNPACSKQLARLWQGEFLCHPRAGHDLPLDDPDWIIDRLQTWYSQ